MAKFIPFPSYYDFAPLDISYVFEDEKPAGKHGFLTTRDDNFYFEDGTLVRFWGCNLNSGACFPEHDYAEKLAKRLAAYGCNMVRLHQMDSEFATPNIYQLSKGKRLSNTRTLCPESMDRLDYLMYCLNKEGIYIYMDNLTYRKFKNEDGVVNARELDYRAAPYCMFDRTLIELQKDYCYNLWNHENPYMGGMKYKDNPQIVLSDVNNESDMFTCFDMQIKVEPYASAFRESYRVWCRENAPETDVDATDLNDITDETLNAYKFKVCDDYFTEMFGYLRSIGVKIPLTGINHSWKYVQCKAAQRLGDFADSHLNIRYMRWSPGVKYFRDLSLHQQPEWGAMRSARRRHFGKPFFTSEWDFTFPHSYRAESSIMLAAVGLLQNWSGYTIHTYAYTSLLQHMHKLGKEVSSETIGNVGYREGIFSTWCDPAKFGMFYHATLMTRRGDVQPAKSKYTVKITDLAGDTGQRINSEKLALMTSTELSQIGVDYWDSCEGTISEKEPLVTLSKGEVRSDTGELYRSWEKGYGIVDTPMTKAVYGDLGKNGEIELNGMGVTCKNEFATIALSSLNNDLPIEKSDSMLLSAVGRVENTNMVVGDAPADKQPNDGVKGYSELKELGEAPIICEVIEADITLKTDRTDLQVWAVNAESAFVGNVPVTFESGTMKFSLGTKSPSIYYLIQAE